MAVDKVDVATPLFFEKNKITYFPDGQKNVLPAHMLEAHIPKELTGASHSTYKTNFGLSLLGFAAGLAILFDVFEIEYLLHQKEIHCTLIATFCALCMAAILTWDSLMKKNEKPLVYGMREQDDLKTAVVLNVLVVLSCVGLIIHAAILGECSDTEDYLIFSGIYSGIGLIAGLAGYNAYSISKTMSEIK